MKEYEPGTLLDIIVKDLQGTKENPRTDIIVAKNYTLYHKVTTDNVVYLTDNRELTLLTTKLFVAPTTPIRCENIDELNHFLNTLTKVRTRERQKENFKKGGVSAFDLTLGQLRFQDCAGSYDRTLHTKLTILPHLKKHLPKKSPDKISNTGDLTHNITIFANPHPHMAKILGEYHYGYKDTFYKDRTVRYDHDIEMLNLLKRVPFYVLENVNRGTYPRDLLPEETQ